MAHLVEKSLRIIKEEGFAAFIRKAFRHVIISFKKRIRPGDFLRMRKIDLDSLEEITVPSGYHVRTFQRGDEDSWTRIMDDVFEQEYKPWNPKINELRNDKEFDPESIFFVDCEGRLVGTVCALASLHEGKKAAFIHMLGVIADHRGKRLGHLLVLCALHYFKKKGYGEVYLDTQYHRAPAIKIYRGLGFKPVYQKPQF
jgi:mycothiol synthase